MTFNTSIQSQLLESPITNFSLLGGQIGKILFADVFTEDNNERLSSLVKDSYQFKATQSQFSFCSGAAGINWVYTYLYRQGVIDFNDYQQLCYDDDRLKALSLKLLEEENYDFLHGATGIVWYFLYKEDAVQRIDYFQRIFDLLEKLMKNDGGMITMREPDTSLISVNFGLAHGIPSILKLCLQAYHLGIATESAQRIANEIVSFLLKNTNEDCTKCFFNYSSVRTHQTRLGWCYGDLSTGFILYQAGKVLQRADVLDFAVSVLLHSAARRTDEDTGIVDAGLCHGASGVLYIFHKLSQELRHKAFDEAKDYWLERTIKYIEYDPSIGYFVKFYQPARKEYLLNSSLLEGLTGVSLVLNSIDNSHFDWDYCMMLNSL